MLLLENGFYMARRLVYANHNELKSESKFWRAIMSKVAVVFRSGTENTGAMAEAVADGAKTATLLFFFIILHGAGGESS